MGNRWLVCGMVLALLASGAERSSAQAKATLTVYPSTLETSPWYESVQVKVRLQNDTDGELLRPQLFAFSNDGFRTKIWPPSASSAPSQAAVVWTAWIQGIRTARLPGTVQFEARYALAGKPGIHRTEVSLTIKPVTAATGAPVEASVQGTFGAITETQGGAGYLIVKNNLDVPVSVREVSIQSADQKSFRLPGPVPPFDVPARSTETRRIELRAAERVRPGKHVVLFQLATEWDEGGHRQARTLTVDKEVTVGVVFESEILKVMGIPSFLVLPGCLFLFTMQLLFTLGVLGLNRHSKVPEFPVTSPGFWVVAITLSGVFAWVYRRVTGADYLSHYGLVDLRNVWLTSVVAGVLVYVALALTTLSRRRRRVPDTTDSQVVTLEKMARRGLGLEANKVRFKMNQVDIAAFLIERLEDGQTMVWVAPIMIATSADSDQGRDWQQRLIKLVDRRADLESISKALGEAETGKHVTMSWDGQRTVPNPYHLKVEGITGWDPSEPIVRIQ